MRIFYYGAIAIGKQSCLLTAFLSSLEGSLTQDNGICSVFSV